MDVIYTNHPDVIALARRAYPEYSGRKYRVRINEHPINVRSCWDGGSRSYYRFIKLDGTTETIEVPAQSAFDAQIPGAEAVPLQPGLACVEHRIFCGKDMGIQIHIHPANAPKYLPAPMDLSDDERIVLKYTAHLKNSYGGRTNIRYTEAHRETQITPERWAAAQKTLIIKKLLDSRGSVTGDGRNAIQ